MRAPKFVAALVATFVVPAVAGTYHTPIAQRAIGDTAVCSVANVGTTPVNVVVTLFDAFGGSITPATNACASGPVPPGAVCDAVVPNNISSFRCSVEASSSKVRPSILVLDSNFRMLASVPATKK